VSLNENICDARHINSGCIGINYLKLGHGKNQDTAKIRTLQKSGHGTAVSLRLISRRDTAVPCPLSHSGAAGIDIKAQAKDQKK